jgi:hypothetical protein
LHCENTEIDDVSFIASANICDEQRVINGHQTGSGDRFTATDKYVRDETRFTLDNDSFVVSYENFLGSEDNTFSVFTGDVVVFVNYSSSSLPAPLVEDQEYYAISDGIGRFKIASSFDSARLGFFIPITGSITGNPVVFRYSEVKYTANGAIDSGEAPKQIIEKLLGSFMADMTYAGGKFTLIPPSYYEPTINFTEDDLKGGLQITPKTSRRDKFNQVKGVFVDPKFDFAPTDYTIVDNYTYKVHDLNESIAIDVPYEFTISESMARNLATMLLYDSKHQLLIRANMKLTALQAQIGDIVTFESERFGFTSHEFALDGAVTDYVNFASSFTPELGDPAYDHAQINRVLLNLPNHKFKCFDVVRILNREEDSKIVWGSETPSESRDLLNGLRVDDHYIVITNDMGYIEEETGRRFTSFVFPPSSGFYSTNDAIPWKDDFVVLFKIGEFPLRLEDNITSISRVQSQTLSDGSTHYYLRLDSDDSSIYGSAVPALPVEYLDPSNPSGISHGSGTWFTGNEIIKREKKAFRIIEMSLNNSDEGGAVYLGVDLTLKEVSYAQFDNFESRVDFEAIPHADQQSEDDSIQNTALSNPITANFNPTNITLETGEALLAGGDLTLLDQDQISSSSLTGTAFDDYRASLLDRAGFKINWEPSDKFTIYRYEISWKYSTEPDSSYRTILVNGGSNSYTVNGLGTGSTVNTKLRAINSIGVSSQTSFQDIVIQSTANPPDLPTGADFEITYEPVSDDRQDLLGVWVKPLFELPQDVEGLPQAIAYHVTESSHSTNGSGSNSNLLYDWGLHYTTWANGSQDIGYSVKEKNGKYLILWMSRWAYYERQYRKSEEYFSVWKAAQGFKPELFDYLIPSQEPFGTYHVAFGLMDVDNRVSTNFVFKKITFPDLPWHQISHRRVFEPDEYFDALYTVRGALGANFNQQAYYDEEIITSNVGSWNGLSATWNDLEATWNNLAGIQSSSETDTNIGPYGSFRNTTLISYQQKMEKFKHEHSFEGDFVAKDIDRMYWSADASTVQFGSSSDYIESGNFSDTNTFGRNPAIRSYRSYVGVGTSSAQNNYVITKFTTDIIGEYYDETKTVNLTQLTQNSSTASNLSGLAGGVWKHGIGTFSTSIAYNSSEMDTNISNFGYQPLIYYRVYVTIPQEGYYWKLVSLQRYKFEGYRRVNSVQAVTIEIRRDSNDNLADIDGITVRLIASFRVI